MNWTRRGDAILEKGEPITFAVGPQGSSWKTQCEYAQRIVTAVNAHDSLVGALRTIGLGIADGRMLATVECIDIARAALSEQKIDL